jgi:hypothetical protein
MIATQADEILADRRVVLLRDIVKTKVLPLGVPTLRRRMRELGIPEVMLGPRKRGIRLVDLDVLLKQSSSIPTKAISNE